VIHEFGADQVDGRHPFASMIYANGKLSGTTQEGGRSGLGTVFSITIDHDNLEPVVYAFRGGLDGAKPHGLYSTSTACSLARPNTAGLK